MDGDGANDIFVGNKGANSFFKKGTRMYIADFDNNGTIEQIICHERDGKYYPILDRDELIKQIASLKRKFLYYKDYGSASMEDIFDSETLSSAMVFNIDMTETTLFKRMGNAFKKTALPPEIQYSNTEAVAIGDFNNDGYKDMVVGGNQYLVKPQFGRLDASRGWLLFQNENGRFEQAYSLNIEGQIRYFEVFDFKNETVLLTAVNDEALNFTRLNNP